LTRYEERYRLTGRATAGLVASVLLVVIGFLWHLPLIFLPLGLILAVLTAQGAGVIDRVRRKTAFRADQAGITLGTVPDKLTVRRGSQLFIPWADVERMPRAAGAGVGDPDDQGLAAGPRPARRGRRGRRARRVHPRYRHRRAPGRGAGRRTGRPREQAGLAAAM
jgi:hypothetical protein